MGVEQPREGIIHGIGVPALSQALGAQLVEGCFCQPMDNTIAALRLFLLAVHIHLTVASFPELSQKLDRAFVGIIPVGGETDEEN